MSAMSAGNSLQRKFCLNPIERYTMVQSPTNVIIVTNNLLKSRILFIMRWFTAAKNPTDVTNVEDNFLGKEDSSNIAKECTSML